MRKAILILIPCLVLWAACGSDNGTGTDGDDNQVVRVVANTAVAEPTLSSPDEAMWSSVAGTNVPINRSGTVNPAAPKGALVPGSVNVKAIVKSATLYMRFQWVDDLDIWKDVWTLNNVDNFNFTRNEDVFNEDQLFVMFAAPDAEPPWFDTWNWRSLTTNYGNRAEGFIYQEGVLTRDPGAQNFALPNKKYLDTSRPRWIHVTKSAFTGAVMYQNEVLDTDTASFGADWVLNQRVPGWIIDSTIIALINENEESRWDIKSVFSWDEGSGTMKLVLARALNTPYGEEDLDMSGLDSVGFRIGILDDQDEISELNSSQQGFSNAYWLVLP
ncbi:MAG: hypothetical protein OEW00_15040 [candidate division Zixibacteria bacterium]|nr:hypothetical protein [candidate division Zixibacteria bacterium]